MYSFLNIFSFTIPAFNGKPELSGPDSQISDLNPAFSWSSVKDAEQYEIEISKSRDFRPLLFNTKVKDPAFYYDASKSPKLEYMQDYYWRVKGLYLDTF